MGLFTVKVRISNVASSNGGERVDLLVDTGATYSTIPEGVLKRMGVHPRGKIRVRLASGRNVTKPWGVALVTVKGRSAGTTVLFGKKGDEPILGATTLELAALGVDPVGKKLVPVQAIQA